METSEGREIMKLVVIGGQYRFEGGPLVHLINIIGDVFEFRVPGCARPFSIRRNIALKIMKPA
jgi:hypothetical protein